MITFKPIIISNNKRQDGSYPVKIRVYFNGKCRRLPTTLVCESKDLTRSLKIKNPDILKKANALILEMRTHTDNLTFSDLDGRDVDWVVQRIKDGMKGERFSLDFFEWSAKYLQTKHGTTRRSYERALNALERFLGSRSLDINEISKGMLLDFMEYIDEEPKIFYNRMREEYVVTDKEKVAKAASSLYIMKLHHIFNAAKDRYNDEDSGVILIPRSPFSTIKKVFPSGGAGQKALDRKVIQQMILAETEDSSVRVALDAFIVSFGLMGANLADLYVATPFKGDRWKYKRAKTTDRREDGAEMQVIIPPQIEPYLKRLQEGGDGRWWLPELHRIGGEKRLCNCNINVYLRKWQKAAGVEDFTFYAARHSFATIARKLGYDLALINDCLCHKDNLQIARTYAEADWDQINAVNQAVMDSFEW